MSNNLSDDVKKLEDYWRSVYGRNPRTAEREAYFLGRIESLRDHLKPSPVMPPDDDLARLVKKSNRVWKLGKREVA